MSHIACGLFLQAVWNLCWCENEHVGMNFGMKPGECLVLVSKSKGREDFTDVSLCE